MAALLGLIAVVAVGGILFVGGGFVINLGRDNKTLRDDTKRAFRAVGMVEQMLIDMQINDKIIGTANDEVNLILHNFRKEIRPLMKDD